MTFGNDLLVLLCLLQLLDTADDGIIACDIILTMDCLEK